MGNALFNINDVAAKNPTSVTIYNIIRAVLLHDDGACYNEMEKYLMAPGVNGSRFYDQSDAINVLLKYDADNNRDLALIMSQTPGLNKRVLWDKLQKVLRAVGFKMRHGRLVGLLEHKVDKAEEVDVEESIGQPDIA